MSNHDWFMTTLCSGLLVIFFASFFMGCSVDSGDIAPFNPSYNPCYPRTPLIDDNGVAYCRPTVLIPDAGTD